MMAMETAMTEEKPPSTGANGAAASPFAWAESFMETISKYSRNSERHLYVYGISVSRCACCRQRLSEGAANCEHCGQEVPAKSKACAGCKSAKPGIWCYECDAYFCEPCHRKPHGLVLGGDRQNRHHCYAVDGSSGKLLKCGSFSDSMLAMTKAARRAQMKLRQDTAPNAPASGDAKPTTDERVSAVAVASEKLRAEEKTAREKKLTAKETSLLASRGTASQQTAPAKTVVEAITEMRESRKRKAPTVDSTASLPPEQQQAHQHPPPVPQRATVLPPTPTPASARPIEGDGRSLYDKLKMQYSAPGADRRIKSEASAAVAAAAAIALRSQQTQSTPVSQPPTASATSSSVTSLPTAHAVPSSHATAIPSAPSITAASASMAIASALGQASHDLVQTLMRPIEPPPQLAPPSTIGLAPSTTTTSTTSRSSTPTHSGSGGTNGSSVMLMASAPATGDPLKGAVVEVYDRANKEVADIEEKIRSLTEYVRRMTAQNVAHAAQMSDHLRQCHAKLPAAEEQRITALAKVIFFSNDLRAFAASLTAQQLRDIPHVLKGCHAKCLALGRTIEELQGKQQQLRNTIDAAANSGDVDTLLRLQSFSEEIERHEATIQQTRRDRDGQFQLMYQFSKRLQEAVSAEQAAMLARRQQPPGA